MSASTGPHAPEVGSSPGILRAIEGAADTTVSVLAFGLEELEERRIADPADLAPLRRHPVVWVDVVGLADVATIEALGNDFNLHALALEDVFSIPQRAKVEAYGDHLFFVAHMFAHADQPDAEQVSLFLGPGWVLTVQERSGDSFEPIRTRIREGRPRIRSLGAAYLAYALIDAIVDGYFPVVERLGETLEQLEARVLEDPRPETLARVHRLKRRLLEVRRTIWPQRDAIAALIRDDDDMIDERTTVYLRDCHDHAIRVMDLVENHREVAAGLVDLYMSSVSNRMNEVMKVLTIIATIFIPLGFIAGVYGMNFDASVSDLNMPELRWRWGYPTVVGLMAAIAGGMLLWFRRRGWL